MAAAVLFALTVCLPIADAATVTVPVDTTLSSSNSGDNGTDGGPDMSGTDGTDSVQVTNNGTDLFINGGLSIFGGNGGSGGPDVSNALGQNGGRGGFGILMDNSSAQTLTVGSGTVMRGGKGGNGFAGGTGGANDTDGGDGGPGADAIEVLGATGIALTFNSATVIGGAGGNGAAAGNAPADPTNTAVGGLGGGGGIGLFLESTASGATINLNGTSSITGGAAGNHGPGLAGAAAEFGENGAEAIVDSSANAIFNFAAGSSVIGGAGGLGANGGAAGDQGVAVRLGFAATGTTINNAGLIRGGSVNSNEGAIHIEASTIAAIINSGTIGGASDDTYAIKQQTANTLTTFTNQAGGSLLNNSANAATFQNNGVITNFTNGGIIRNFGVGPAIEASGTITNFANSGTIQAGNAGDPFGGALAIYSSAFDHDVINTGGVMTSSQGAGLGTVELNVDMGGLFVIAGGSILNTGAGYGLDVVAAQSGTVRLNNLAIDGIQFDADNQTLDLRGATVNKGIAFAGGTNILVFQSAVTSTLGVNSGITTTGGGTVDVSVTSGASLISNAALTSGAINTFTIAGGAVTLNNSLTVSQVSVAGGSLTVAAGTLTGTVDGSSVAEVVTNAGTISGNVTLYGGADTLELRQGYSFGGTVRGGVGTDILRFGGSSNASFDLSLLGSGLQYDEFEGLEKTGASVWNVTGNSSFNGTIDIAAGNFNYNGQSQNLSVNLTGGTFSGTSAIDGLTVGSGATVSPGNSIGTINLDGSVNFLAGSTYVVEVAPNGTSDQIVATGNANIFGGTVQIVPSASSGFLANTQYTIITANNGVGGTFDTLAPLNAPLVAGVLSYDTNNVYFLLQQVLSFNSVSGTANQESVADAIDAIQTANSGSSALNNAINTLAAQTTEDLLDGLDDLAGQSLADGKRFTTALGGDWHRFVARSVRAGGGERIWAGIFGGNGGLDATSGFYGADRDVFGGGLGGRLYAGERIKLGGAIGLSSGKMDGGRSDAIDADTVHAALYAEGSFSGVDLSAEASLGFTSLESARRIAFLSETARGEADATLWGFSLDAAYPVALNERLTLSPYAAIEHFISDRDGFTETGAPGVNQIHGSASDRLTDLSAGTRLRYDAAPLLLSGYLGARNSVSNERPGFTAAFEGDPGTTFSILGVEQPETMGLVGVEAEWAVSPSTALRFGYDGAFGDGADTYTLRASAATRF